MSRFYIFVFVLILNTLSIFSQEKILEFSTAHPKRKSLMENSFTLVNPVDGSFVVFLSKNSNVSAYHFNEKMEYQSEIYSSLLPNKLKTPLGGTIDDLKYTLFFCNKNKTKFAGTTFDFETKIATTKAIDLKLKRETQLTHFNYKNTFYIVTVSHKENHIYLYGINASGSFEKQTIDLSKHELFRLASYPVSVHKALSADIFTKPIYKFQWIQKNIPYSLDSMTSFYKLYLEGDTIHLVSDINPNFTQVISYDLLKKDVQVNQFKQSAFEKDDTLSNSFLSDSILYQFRINPKEMALNISDFNTGKVLKEHRITKKENLHLASGAIRQRGGQYKKYRELEKTAQFLRKVGNSYPSIYVDNFKGAQKILLGSVEEIDNSALQVLAMANPFVGVVAIGSVTLFINPAAAALYTSSDTKAVYITSYLDENFLPVQITEKDDIFYRVTDYLKQEKMKRYTAADIFQYKDYFLFGMLDKKTKQYSLRKFEK